MRIATLNNQPVLFIDRPLTAAAPPPATVAEGMVTSLITSPAPGMCHDAIPLAAIASWKTLLGIDNDTEAVAAILHVRDHGEPDPDPETGENAWTSAYNAIENTLNDQTTAQLADDTTVDGQLTAGRNKTRSLLGLPLLPDTTTPARLADDTPTAIALPDGIATDELATLLADHADDITAATDRFITSLTRTNEREQ
ncbi:transcriptional regulator [Bifidobacterium reuteri]|uniref:Transcriptional regulator n=1 Tax=Bifidobacterium reuteri TaxID=983706 RepID=A0A5J5EBU4_9BIFI|nr:transcriptional regulator [Bifidobacterium reuteri]KAA8826838.1 transcriptional regulator [Bifidobacterium reuteri]